MQIVFRTDIQIGDRDYHLTRYADNSCHIVRMGQGLENDEMILRMSGEALLVLKTLFEQEQSVEVAPNVIMERPSKRAPKKTKGQTPNEKAFWEGVEELRK